MLQKTNAGAGHSTTRLFTLTCNTASSFPFAVRPYSSSWLKDRWIVDRYFATRTSKLLCESV